MSDVDSAGLHYFRSADTSPGIPDGEAFSHVESQPMKNDQYDNDGSLFYSR